MRSFAPFTDECDAPSTLCKLPLLSTPAPLPRPLRSTGLIPTCPFPHLPMIPCSHVPMLGSNLTITVSLPTGSSEIERSNCQQRQHRHVPLPLASSPLVHSPISPCSHVGKQSHHYCLTPDRRSGDRVQQLPTGASTGTRRPTWPHAHFPMFPSGHLGNSDHQG